MSKEVRIVAAARQHPPTAQSPGVRHVRHSASRSWLKVKHKRCGNDDKDCSSHGLVLCTCRPWLWRACGVAAGDWTGPPTAQPVVGVNRMAGSSRTGRLCTDKAVHHWTLQPVIYTVLRIYEVQHIAQPAEPASLLLSSFQLFTHPTFTRTPTLSRAPNRGRTATATIGHVWVSRAMRPTSPSALSLATLALGVSATASPRFDWVNGLGECWKQCLQLADDGCNSSKCICDASQSDTFLPPAAGCIYRGCKDGRLVELGLLVPVQTYCAFAGNPIPDYVVQSAYAATTIQVRTSSAPPLTTRKVDNSPKSSTRQGDVQLTKVYTTTFTQTSIDGDGNTVLVEIPIAMGPDTLSSGKPFTTTLDKQTRVSSDSRPSSSAIASPTSAPEVSTAPSKSTPTSQPTQRVLNGNGSPFGNTNAAAHRWRVSGAAVGMGVIGGLLMRLPS